METNQIINAVRIAEYTAANFTVPDDELHAWMNENLTTTPAGEAASDEFVTVYPGGGAKVHDYLRFRRALAYTEALHRQPAFTKSYTWTYAHRAGPAESPTDLHGEASLNWRGKDGLEPTLLDVVMVNLTSFAGQVNDLERVLTRFAATGAILVLFPMESLGLDPVGMPAWMQTHLGYLAAMDDGCIYRPRLDDLDY